MEKIKGTTDKSFPFYLIKKVGINCNVNPTVQFYGNPDDFEIGDNVRIDAFCILSGKIKLGSFIHISAGVYIFGSSKVILEDYSGLSSNVVLYTATDDFTEGHLINPMIPNEFRKVQSGPIHLKKHVQIGAGTIVLPNVTFGVGSTVGAMSFVKKSVEDFAVMAGCPAKKIRERNRERLFELEEKHKQNELRLRFVKI